MYCSLRAKMAAQVDLLCAKVTLEEAKVRDSLDRLIREKKKKKKRELSPSADKRDKSVKEAKKVKLHHHHHNHHQHAEHRTHQPHQLHQKPKPHKFSAEKHVLHSHHHHHHGHSLTNGTKKLQPALPPAAPGKVPEQLQKKQQRAVLPEPPALFTFTPLKTVKAKPQDFKEKHREKELKLKLKKENTEANVKHGEVKKKKGECYYVMHILKGYFIYKLNGIYVLDSPKVVSSVQGTR